MQVLSDDDMKRLGALYGESDAERDHGFDRSIGSLVTEVSELAAAIDTDMDTTVHGVRWWVGHPVGDKRRILISDHLIECVRSIEKNLVDARLHQLALVHCDALEAHQMRHIVTVKQGQLAMEFPKRLTPLDDLPRSFGDLHRVGFFRAVGSALDCLGGACVGVLGLPVDLLKSDLGSARAWLKKQQQVVSSSFDASFWKAFGLHLEDTIVAAGPLDWLTGRSTCATCRCTERVGFNLRRCILVLLVRAQPVAIRRSSVMLLSICRSRRRTRMSR